MTITFARTGTGYDSSSYEAPTPAGTGGVIVVAAFGRDGAMSPATPSDWSSSLGFSGYAEAYLQGVWYAPADSNPDMTFVKAGTGENGLYSVRVDNAQIAPVVIAVNETTPGSFHSTIDVPDVASAQDGVALLFVSMQGTDNLASTSLGFTEHYDGQIGEAGWWARSCAVLSLDPVTPGGGTWDGGTITFSGEMAVGALSLVIKTGSGDTVPTAIADLAGTAGATAVTLTHTAPDDGGDTITDYVYQFREDSTLTPTPVTSAAVSSGFSATRSPSFTLGAAPQENDIILVFPSSTTGAAITPNVTWNNVLSGTTDVESDAHQICALWHRVTADEAGTTAWTMTNIYDATETGNVSAVLIRGALSEGNPIQASNTGFNSGNTTTPHVLAGIANTGAAGGLIISAVAKDSTGAYSTQPSGWTFLTTSNTNQGKAVLRRTALNTVNENLSATNITPSAGDEYVSITVVIAAGYPAWQTFSDATTTTLGTTITGLTNDTDYLFRAAAINGVGQSAWSNVAGPYTPVSSTIDLNLQLGDSTVDAFYLGDSQVDALYLGDSQVF